MRVCVSVRDVEHWTVVCVNAVYKASEARSRLTRRSIWVHARTYGTKDAMDLVWFGFWFSLIRNKCYHRQYTTAHHIGTSMYMLRLVLMYISSVRRGTPLTPCTCSKHIYYKQFIVATVIVVRCLHVMKSTSAANWFQLFLFWFFCLHCARKKRCDANSSSALLAKRMGCVETPLLGARYSTLWSAELCCTTVVQYHRATEQALLLSKYHIEGWDACQTGPESCAALRCAVQSWTSELNWAGV